MIFCATHFSSSNIAPGHSISSSSQTWFQTNDDDPGTNVNISWNMKNNTDGRQSAFLPRPSFPPDAKEQHSCSPLFKLNQADG